MKTRYKNQDLLKGWRKVRLGDFVKVIPSVQLQRGKKYPFLDMADVQPLSRTANWPKTKVFNGSGARFENRDTLFARITPCLENGKITQALNLDAGGFGSTEFYVLRGKDDISDSDFVHYLSRTYRIRKLAESSMVGASGRQRVERAAFENIEVEIPENINTQKRIAGVLSAFDDKIELNNKISKNLEQMARVIFKEWFVKFNFPVEFEVKSEKLKVKSLGYKDAGGKMVDSELGKIPEGWEMANLGDIADIQWGDTTKTKASYKNVGYPAYSASGSDGFLNYFDFNKTGVILGAIGANCGATWLAHDKWSCIKNTIRFWSKSEKASTEYLYLATKNSAIWPKRGSAQPFITLGDARDIKIIVPPKDMMDKIREYFEKAFISIEHNKLENQKLAALRDVLLPKLMSGEVEV